MLYTEKRPDFAHEDGRGFLRQLVHCGYSQVNVIRSEKGAVRGGHFHKRNREAFYILSGCGKVVLCDGKEKETFHFVPGDFFEVPPFVSHRFFYEEDSTLVSLYSEGVEQGDGTKDIYPETFEMSTL